MTIILDANQDEDLSLAAEQHLAKHFMAWLLNQLTLTNT